MGQLARSTHQVSATMAGLIDRLVRDGLVTRRRDEEDRRTVMVAITPAGQQTVADAWDRILEPMDKVLAEMDTDEVNEAYDFVDSLLAIMDK